VGLVYSGTVESGSYLYNSTTGTRERLSRIVRLQADKREEVKKLKESTIEIQKPNVRNVKDLCDKLIGVSARFGNAGVRTL
jgi:translation elongation factor EF-G